MVYDFLPDALLEKVENRERVRRSAGVRQVDRQCRLAPGDLLSRAANRHRTEQTETDDWDSSRKWWTMVMYSTGRTGAFGIHPLQGLYFRPLVYAQVRGWTDFEPWLDRIRHFPDEIVDQAVKQIPPSWLEGGGGELGRDELERLLERVLARRKRVADLILECRSARGDPFPAWKR